MLRFHLLVLTITFSFIGLLGQDKHFTQYYAAPMTINPALTGAIQGKYRLGLVRRDQWRQSLESPYVTTAGAVAAPLMTGFPWTLSTTTRQRGHSHQIVIIINNNNNS